MGYRKIEECKLPSTTPKLFNVGGTKIWGGGGARAPDAHHASSGEMTAHAVWRCSCGAMAVTGIDTTNPGKCGMCGS